MFVDGLLLSGVKRIVSRFPLTFGRAGRIGLFVALLMGGRRKVLRRGLRFRGTVKISKFVVASGGSASSAPSVVHGCGRGK